MRTTLVANIAVLFMLHAFISLEGVAQSSLPGNTNLSGKYLLDHWTIEDGLPVNSVQDIMQSSDGYLWLATHDGLVRFDGIDFKLYSSADYGGLKSNRIHFIEEAADGSILIKTQGVHISRLKDGAITHLLSLDISISGNGRGSKFYKDSNGDVWVGGDTGMYIYRDGSLERALPELVNFQVLNILHVSESEIWFTSEEDFGLYRVRNGALTQILSREPGWEYVFGLHNNTFWIGSFHGLYRFKDEKLDTLFSSENLKVIGLVVISDSEVFLEDADKGYFEVADGELSPYTFVESKTNYSAPRVLSKNTVVINNDKVLENPDISILDFERDREGNIWIGTFLNGLLKISPKLFKTYSIDEGLPGRAVYPLFQSRDSTIWVGTFGQGIAKIEDGKVEAGYILNQKINDGYLQSFGETEDGTLLVTTIGKGLQFLDKKTKVVKPYDAPENLSKEPIFSIFRDSKNRLWLGSNPYPAGGLYMQENGEWEQISGNKNVPFTAVRSMLETSSGQLWFATTGHGIIRFDGTKYHNYTTPDGLSSNTVRALHITQEESGDVLWVGYESKGIDRIELNNEVPDLTTITNYQTNDGLFDNSVHIILEDDQQRFWINSNRGIFRVSRSELNAFHKKEIETVYSHGYTEHDGLLNREGNGGVYPAGFIAYDGFIWFPTQDGVVSFHPDSIVGNTFIPPVDIQSINLSERNFPIFEDEIQLERGERDIEISYASLSFTDAHENQYRYILEGYDKEWRTVGTRRTAYYTNLASGTYTFRVQGSNNEGIWNTEGASLTVVVQPFFYETSAFYFLMMLLVASLLLGILQLRNRYFKKREQVLKEEVANRTKELEEEKEKTEQQAQQLLELDEVKSRFFTDITHELRTPLTLIMGPLEQLVNEEVDLNTENGKRQKEMMLRNSKRLLKLVDQLLDISKLESKNVPIKPEPILLIPFLRKTVALFTEAFEHKRIGLSVTSSALTNKICIDPEKIEKVIGNIIANAIKFTPEGGQITISLDETDRELSIKISDTGIGIKPEEVHKVFNRFYRTENATASGFGIGLSIAKEMVELHHGSIQVESQEGSGTTFYITLLKGHDHFIKDGYNGVCSKAAVESADQPELFIEDILIENQEPTLPVNFSHDKTTVLIVDDHADMRFYISSILGDEYQIVEAKNGKEALDKINASPPDLIVADMMMPEMDGMELNKKLKENPITVAIPFVFLTAKTDKDTRISSIEEGADFFLTKPFDAKELRAIVKNLLCIRHGLRERISKEEKSESSFLNPDIKKLDPFTQKIYEVLEEEYSNQDLSVSLIQEKMFMSRSVLYRTINEKMGINTQQLVNKFRLEKAAQLLMNDEGNISEIAYACGFKSLSYFSKSFKDYFKKSPSEFVRTNSVNG